MSFGEPEQDSPIRMESKDREFQKAIIRILILMATGLIVWNLAVSVTNRRIAVIYYERISAIFGAISAQYPDMEHGDWMQYLNATGNEEDGEAFLHLAEWKQIDIQVMGEEEPFIKGDRHWLEEALVNLIKNAIEHSPEDSEIRIQVEDNQVYTCIHVRDFGSGISYEDQKHIFERCENI